LYFQLLYLPEETCFQQAGTSVVESTNQAILGFSAVEDSRQPVLRSSNQRKLPGSMSLFLKNEKISGVLYLGKGLEYRPFRDF